MGAVVGFGSFYALCHVAAERYMVRRDATVAANQSGEAGSTPKEATRTPAEQAAHPGRASVWIHLASVAGASFAYGAASRSLARGMYAGAVIAAASTPAYVWLYQYQGYPTPNAWLEKVPLPKPVADYVKATMILPTTATAVPATPTASGTSSDSAQSPPVNVTLTETAQFTGVTTASPVLATPVSVADNLK
ncbi:hypothetical protein EON66_06505 [archaeon]|nr:MAG: hypothetical protein EON66_06505 [archaeon]